MSSNSSSQYWPDLYLVLNSAHHNYKFFTPSFQKLAKLFDLSFKNFHKVSQTYFLKKQILLRFNLYMINCIHLKCTLWWILISGYGRVVTDTVMIQSISFPEGDSFASLCSPFGCSSRAKFTLLLSLEISLAFLFHSLYWFWDSSWILLIFLVCGYCE